MATAAEPRSDVNRAALDYWRGADAVIVTREDLRFPERGARLGVNAREGGAGLSAGVANLHVLPDAVDLSDNRRRIRRLLGPGFAAPEDRASRLLKGSKGPQFAARRA